MATCSEKVTVRGFPFLDHEHTVTYNRNSKVMFILRGLSGSGKSTVVGALREKYPQHVVCSADDHFTDKDGLYKFEKTALTAAHEACQAKAKLACEAATPVVIIDNTNVCRWEIKVYVDVAASHSYTVVLVSPKTAWCLDAAVLAKKNKHQVSEVVLKQKVQMFMRENMNPVYWGWFLNEKGTDKILDLGSKYFSLCAKHCNEFAEFFKENVLGPDKELTYSSLYSREKASTRTLHCTAYFCGRQTHPEAQAYANDPAVLKAMGKCFPITVIGIVITPRTIGARVKLNNKELKLWHTSTADAAAEEEEEEKTPVLASRFNMLALADDDDDDAGPPRFHPTSGRGSRAHLTLGCAPGVLAVETGKDQVRLVKLEGERLDDDDDFEVDYVAVDGGAIKYYGEGRCVVYLDEPVVVPSLFSGKY